MKDIGPGDVVVCVNDDPCSTPGCGENYGVAKGKTYRVATTHPVDNWTGLTLVGVDIGRMHLSIPHWKFRKLNDEPDNAELITKIRACKPIKEHRHA